MALPRYPNMYKLHNSYPNYLWKMCLTTGPLSLKMVDMLILLALLVAPIIAMPMAMLDPERVRVAAVVERRRK